MLPQPGGLTSTAFGVALAGMFCTFALEKQFPRIVPGGTVGKGFPALTPVMNVPVIPRVGEEIFLIGEGATSRHTVTSVRYLLQGDQMTGAYVLVTEGEPVT